MSAIGQNTERQVEQRYARIVGRWDELDRLSLQAQQRRPLLVFGPEGVGKTRLFQAFAEKHPYALYVAQGRSPRNLLLSLANSLRSMPGVRGISSQTSTMSTSSLKGVVDEALNAKPFLLIVDHLEGPSRVVTKLIKQLGYYGRTPIFLGARSPHMEDIGTLQAFCADKSERLELLNWPQPVALEFAHQEAERTGLRAANVEAALQAFVQASGGNPGGIVRMVEMASQTQYRVDDQIKFHVLYLDYRMGRG